MMKLFGRQIPDELVVVAEMGVNHEGSLARATEILHGLAESGVDAVKLQSYTPDRFISQADEARFVRVSRFALSEEDHDELFELAVTLGLNLFSTAASEDWVPYLATKSSVLKVASGDITFKPTIQAGAELFDQMIISTGASTVEEIDQAVQWVAEASPVPLREKLVLLHCVSAYPAPAEEANLGAIRYLQERYGVAVGFSSHFGEEFVPIAAVAAGASVVEIHVTDQKSGREFRDHALSFEPDQVSDLVKAFRQTHRAAKQLGKAVQPSEKPLRESMRKKAIATRDLPHGEMLDDVDWAFARAPQGLGFADWERISKKTVAVDTKQGFPIALLDPLD
jgi:N,N'-diacetyllegionaminate synthase